HAGPAGHPARLGVVAGADARGNQVVVLVVDVQVEAGAAVAADRAGGQLVAVEVDAEDVGGVRIHRVVGVLRAAHGAAGALFEAAGDAAGQGRDGVVVAGHLLG